MERARIEKSVAVINAVYGAPARLKALAADIVEHWETRSSEMRKFIDFPGKAFIVGATREICAKLYDEIIKLRPDWHNDAVDKGMIKVVYSGSAQDQRCRSPSTSAAMAQNKVIQKRLRRRRRRATDRHRQGHDAHRLRRAAAAHALPRPAAQGALLMQTLARVNRTFRGKPDGLLVAYAPLADNLNQGARRVHRDRPGRQTGRQEHRRGRRRCTDLLIATLDEVCAGYDWRTKLDGGPRSWIKAAVGLTNYLRSPATPGNQVAEGEETLGDRYRKLANQLARPGHCAPASRHLDGPAS